MSTMTFVPVQYPTSIEAPASASSITLPGANSPDTRTFLYLPSLLLVTGGAALSHSVLLFMFSDAAMVWSVEALALAVILLMLAIGAGRAITLTLATSNLIVTLWLVHPEWAAAPVAALWLQGGVMLMAWLIERAARQLPTVTWSRADFSSLATLV